ncbi:hypothetical protein FRC00_011092 [Tulasnella sp. 408]|nr:hypothetical protein FRC00_011092 [Tulasnella sp. 408]
MKTGKSTDNLDDKADSKSGYAPWPPVTDVSTTWHTKSTFFQELLSDTDKLIKFMNLDGFCDRMRELLKYSSDTCSCISFSDDECDDVKVDKRLESKYCPEGMMKLDHREFVVLEQWIPKMDEAVERLVELRDRMVTQASLSRRNMEERLAFLDDDASRRIRKKFPDGIDLPVINNIFPRSDDNESVSDCGASAEDTDLHHVADQASTPAQSESHLWSLPVEILYDVILEAQRLDPHIHLTLSHVNQYFRNLVNTSPILWSKIDFWYPLSVASLYLERSAEADLDVSADRGLHSSKGYTEVVGFYHLLRPHRHRIRRLTLQAADPSWLEPVAQNLDQPNNEFTARQDHFLWSPMLCNLEYLDLGYSDWDSMEFPGQPVIKNLQELRLSGPCRESILFLVSPSLKRLTLNIPHLNLSKLKNTLSSTPSLQSLALVDVFLVPPSSESADSPVDVQSLKSLSIIRSPPSTVQSLLRVITCPNLQRLYLHFTGEVNEARTGAYRVFDAIDVTQLQLFHKPHLEIRYLDLVSCEAEPAFLQKTLDGLPGLKHLRIASAALTDEHLETLVFKGTGSKRCSQLTSLTVDNEPEVSSAVIRRIVQSRDEASIPLQSVKLRGFDSARISWEDVELIRSSGAVDLTITVFAEDEVIGSVEDSDWSSSWSSDEESE